jgi:hypothetical protein
MVSTDAALVAGIVIIVLAIIGLFFVIRWFRQGSVRWVLKNSESLIVGEDDMAQTPPNQYNSQLRP